MTTLGPWLRHGAVIAVAGAMALAASHARAAPTPPQLQNRIAGVQRHEQALRSAAAGDTARVRELQGRIDDVQVRLDALEQSSAIEQRLLDGLQLQLRAARARLAMLRDRLVVDREALRAQLVAAYESPPPDITTVLLDSRGFADLLERLDAFKRIQGENVRTIVAVKAARGEVTRQAARLADLEARQQRITDAIVVQRDEVAQLREALGARQRSFLRSRAGKRSQLGALASHRRKLEEQLSQIEGVTTGGSLATDGVYGFFPYPGTNYSVGSEPELARRLNAMARALHLHLIGVSGYRSPQHSIEVGGFADDPHTRGEASDTPGVEGVGEATLNQFGLTRPFGGAREADHIQLAG